MYISNSIISYHKYHGYRSHIVSLDKILLYTFAPGSLKTMRKRNKLISTSPTAIPPLISPYNQTPHQWWAAISPSLKLPPLISTHLRSCPRQPRQPGRRSSSSSDGERGTTRDAGVDGALTGAGSVANAGASDAVLVGDDARRFLLSQCAVVLLQLEKVLS